MKARKSIQAQGIGNGDAHAGDMRASTCDHCGAVCTSASVRSDEHIFCCTGCRLVYGLQKQDAVCDVIGNDTVSREKFTRIGIPRCAFLDDPQVVQRFLRYRNDKISQCLLRVPTIHCASCIWTLENLHRIDPAVRRAEVHFLERTVSITFLHDELSFRQLVELCIRLGYEPDLNTEEDTSVAQRTDSMRSLVMKLGVAGFAFGNAMIFAAPDYLAAYHGDTRALSPSLASLFAFLRVLLSIPVLLYSASDFFLNSWNALRKRSISLDVPVALGLVALFTRSITDIVLGYGTGYLDSFTGLVFFLLTARVVQTKSFRSLAFHRTFTSFFPLSATRENSDGSCESVAISLLRKDDIIHVRNGEIIPADGVLVGSHAHLDYSFVSGESEISETLRGAHVYAGAKVVGSEARCKVTRPVSSAYLTQLWNASVFHRDKVQRADTISRLFATGFTAVVLAIAVATAVMWWPDSAMALSGMVAVLIVACPCALTLAAPFTYGAAMTLLGRKSLYLRSSNVIADMSGIDTIVFDKTGTLTSGSGYNVTFQGTALNNAELDLLLSATSSSHHPLSRAVSQFLRETHHTSGIELRETASFREYPGSGTECTVNGHAIRIGSLDFIAKTSLKTSLKSSKTSSDDSSHEASDSNSVAFSGESNHTVSTLFVSIDGVSRGCFQVTNDLRAGMSRVLQALSTNYDVYVMSGDTDRHRTLFHGIVAEDHLLFQQQPTDKLRRIEELQQQGRKVAMIGDGANDAGALRQANCGIAVSDMTGAFTPASDAIIAGTALHLLPEMFWIARHARRVLALAFAVSVVYNGIGLTMACSGNLTPVFAAFFMPLSSWSVVGIAYGLMRLSEPQALQFSLHDRQKHDSVLHRPL